MKQLLQEIEKYINNNKGLKIDNPIIYIANVGFDRMTEIVREANETNKIIEFSYEGRKLKWKYKKNGR